MINCWVSQVYTNIRKFREDLSAYPPHHFVCVPMVLDTLYGRVCFHSPASPAISYARLCCKLSIRKFHQS